MPDEASPLSRTVAGENKRHFFLPFFATHIYARGCQKMCLIIRGRAYVHPILHEMNQRIAPAFI